MPLTIEFENVAGMTYGIINDNFEIEKTKIGGPKNEPFFHQLDGFTNTIKTNFDLNTLNSLKKTWYDDLHSYKKMF